MFNYSPRKKNIPHSDENQDLSFDITMTPYVAHVPTSYEEVDTDNVHAICYDHENGIWEN